jgi:hypothetical protein
MLTSPCIMIMYLFVFCGSSLYFFINHNTSYIYKDVIVSNLHSLNTFLHEVSLPTPHIVWITLFCCLNINILSLSTPQKIMPYLASDSNFAWYKHFIILNPFRPWTKCMKEQKPSMHWWLHNPSFRVFLLLIFNNFLCI